MLTRLVEQVEGYAALLDEHADVFAKLFGALLGESVRFDGPTEKWIVWPAAGDARDPREEELRAKNIRVVGYSEQGAGRQPLRDRTSAAKPREGPCGRFRSGDGSPDRSPPSETWLQLLDSNQRPGG